MADSSEKLEERDEGEKQSDPSVEESEKQDKDESKQDKDPPIEEKPEEGEKKEEEVKPETKEETKVEPEIKSLPPQEGKEEDPSKAKEEVGEEEEEINYEYNEMYSKPVVSKLPPDTLQFIQSYGYDCQKRSNLLAIDTDTLLYTAGNYLVFVSISTGGHIYLRSLGGKSIGAITVSPSSQYIAVGEKGVNPYIAIYEYPSLKLYRILREGTEQLYSHLDFNPDGSLLASIGGNPDYMLTVWDWRKESIVLRSKAFSQDIYRVSFSPELPGQLTTSGTGHIRFWKMATTFTGLKLQGYLGKFGRTELSDISAYVELPDGKVLSGTEWGNLLLWDGGFIKVELAKKGKKLCHNGNVEALFLDEGELISAGVDGYIRIWDFEIIDGADITEESTVFEMEPLTEIKVGSDVSIKSLTRSTDPNTPTIWYAQDAKGSIWKLDIVVSHTRKVPERLFRYHSGQIKSIDCSPVTHYAASIAEDGSVRVYDLESNKLLCHSKYTSGGNSLLWAPLSVDPNGLTLITGHSDGVLRVLSINELSTISSSSRVGAGPGTPVGDLSLVHACKPHTKDINSISVNPTGTILATGSADGTVFFLNLKDNYSPIGYVTAPAPVKYMEWNKRKEGEEEGTAPVTLLVCCSEGSMALVTLPPTLLGIDTTHSYHLSSVKVVSRSFVSIKDRLKREEAEAKKLAEKERRRKERLAQRQARKERLRQELGDQYESEEEEEEEEEQEEEQEEEEGEGEDEEKEDKPTGPSPLLTVFTDHSDDSYYWISMGGYDCGYLYQCTLKGANDTNSPYEPPHSIPIPSITAGDIPLHSIKFNSNGQYLLAGSDNGSVEIHKLTDPYSLSGLKEEAHGLWSLGTHDNHYGQVSCMSLTYDDQYLLTGGGDGNVFVYKTNFSTSRPSTSHTAKIADSDAQAIKRRIDTTDDIEDASHYSIEDAKQKAEQDRKLKAAEAKKQKVRRDIMLLRRTFTELQQRSQHLPKHLRLKQEEFMMDPSISEQLQKQLADKLDLVRREMAWESEKHSVALKKLQKKYKDTVECERTVVWTVRGGYWVSTFRCAAPSSQYLELLEKILSSDQASTNTPSTAGTGPSGRVPMRRKTRGQDTLALDVLKGKGSIAESVDLSKSEIRRQKKEKRRREWEEFNQTKPGAGYEDPEEVLAISKAKSEMGDYKLKTSSDYVVSDQQRMSTEKKRRELLICRNNIFDAKRKYNDKLMTLRDYKIEMIKKITLLVNELKSAQRHLPLSLRKPLPSIPTLKPEEVPERELEYTKETLIKFRDDKEKREKAEKDAAAGVGEGFGGFGGFGGGGEETKNEEEDSSPSSGTSSSHSIGTKGGGGEGEEGKGKGDDYQLSDLEVLISNEEEVLKIYRQDSLLADIEDLVKSFDDTVVHLRHEKSLLDVVMKLTELKHLTQFEELELLKEFEKRETNFTTKYRTKKKERGDLEVKIEEIEWEVQEKEKLVSLLQEQEKALDHEFMEAVGENNKFKDFLLKVYRKKIKRAKQKQGEAEDSDDEDKDEDDESDSDDMSSTDEESDEEGLDDSVCPPGCDQTVFDKAITMREKRLDLEDSITEEKKMLEGLKKERDGLLKKAKSMESHVKTALQDLQAFQLKKQQRMNELDSVVLLKLHQILHYQAQGEPPTSVGQCLVFPASARENLAQRIGELVQEKQHEKKRYRELRLQHVRMTRDRKSHEKKVAELNEKANEMMMLKFGRVVNLDALEGLTTNKLIGELEQTLKEAERKYERAKHSLETKINDVKYELLSEVQQNTQKLDELNEFSNQSRQLEESLNQTQKNWGDDISGGSLFEPEEKAKLLDIVSIQSREIEALREEIRVLSLKGGHILPPAQPPNMLAGSS